VSSRLGACGVDLAILVFAWVLFLAAGEITLLPPENGFFFSPGKLLDSAAPFFLMFFGVSFGYFTLFHFLTGQTPGKMLFGLHLESADNGAPLLFSQAFLHSIGGLLSCLALGMGYLGIVFKKRRRGWNDRLAGTCTVLRKNDDGVALEDCSEEGA
jgi:uncharacterized RDD family membrane protein YckC